MERACRLAISCTHNLCDLRTYIPLRMLAGLVILRYRSCLSRGSVRVEATLQPGTIISYGRLTCISWVPLPPPPPSILLHASRRLLLKYKQ